MSPEAALLHRNHKKLLYKTGPRRRWHLINGRNSTINSASTPADRRAAHWQKLSGGEWQSCIRPDRSTASESPTPLRWPDGGDLETTKGKMKNGLGAKGKMRQSSWFILFAKGSRSYVTYLSPRTTPHNRGLLRVRWRISRRRRRRRGLQLIGLTSLSPPSNVWINNQKIDH